MTTETTETMTTETEDKVKTIEFRVRETYVDDTHLCGKEILIKGTVSEDQMGNDIYDLTRQDTGEHIYPYQLDGMELLGERSYVAVSGYGMGWGKANSLSECVDNVIKASGISKAKAKQLEVLRGINVYECVKGSGYVTGMGGACGLMLKPVRATDWMSALWELVKPKAKGARARA